MAEIKIEKKKPIWPWILVGLIVLAGILFVVFATGDDDDFNDDDRMETTRDRDTIDQMDRGTTTYDETTTTATGGNAVDRYISHVGDKSRMGLDHEYTNSALIHLMNAVEAKARENNVNIDRDLDEVRRHAEGVTRDPMATNHADKIKAAGTKLADALETIQRDSYPNLSDDVREVKESVQEIDTSVLTLDQREEVNSFFDDAADVLRKMS